MTYFYCTTKIDNHYKVGISRSYRGIRSRLSDYRQISPHTNIKFFTEVPSKSIEDSFKDKFWHFRIANSECYDLRLDIIFKHVLKYIHEDSQLFGFWDFSRYYISEHYFTKKSENTGSFYERSYSFSQREHDSFRHRKFVCVGTYDQLRNKKTNESIKNKKGKNKYKIKHVSFNSQEQMNQYFKDYNHFINKIYYTDKKGTRHDQIQRTKDFEEQKFDQKKTCFKDSDAFAERDLEIEIFNQIKKHSPRLVNSYKKYENPDRPERRFHWGHYGITSKNWQRRERINNVFTADYSHLRRRLEQEVARKTYLNKTDFINYFDMLLHEILDVRAIGFDKTKNEYINNIQAILRRAYRNIMDDISNLSYKKETPEEVDKKTTERAVDRIQQERLTHTDLFIKSVKLLISPNDKGFTMGMVKPSMKGLKEEEKEMCTNIARGMIKYASEDPHKFFTAGKQARKNEAKTEENNSNVENINDKKNVIDFLDKVSKSKKNE